MNLDLKWIDQEVKPTGHLQQCRNDMLGMQNLRLPCKMSESADIGQADQQSG
jgi:hypothetical protein